MAAAILAMGIRVSGLIGGGVGLIGDWVMLMGVGVAGPGGRGSYFVPFHY